MGLDMTLDMDKKFDILELLNDIEFDYKINEDDTLSLIDLQHVNLGNIEGDEFAVNEDIASFLIERLDIYIYDYFVNGYIETLEEECNEKVLKKYYPDILKLMLKHREKFEDSIELMQAIINPEMFNVSKIIADSKLHKKCPKCNSRLRYSTVDGYKYQCMECDEDFYSFEVG